MIFVAICPLTIINDSCICVQSGKRQCLIGSGSVNDNDNDKRLGLTAQADQPDHKNTVH